jgi:hypothetical protein
MNMDPQAHIRSLPPKGAQASRAKWSAGSACAGAALQEA